MQTEKLRSLVEQVQNRTPTPKLIIIQGIPGSGKTTAAKYLAKELHGVYHEADKYFTKPDGSYVFAPSKLEEAHNWCLQQTKEDLASGITVIVSNTFTTAWGIRKYMDEFSGKYPICLVRMSTVYQTIHNVPKTTIDKMKNQLEKSTNTFKPDIIIS